MICEVFFMNDSPENDAFTQSVIGHIHPKVFATLNAEQIQAIRDAVFQCRPAKKHLINIRGFIPLIFARYYFVFLLGRDRRKEKKAVEYERRQSI
jgi:hypothetical protein